MLKKELATLKNDKNEWIFSNEDINKIINNENDIAELSKILHGFKTNKFDFAYPYLKEILTNEGITFKDVQAGLELAKYIQESPEFKEIKDKLLKNSSVFKVTKETAENIKNNAYLIGEIKTHFPKDFERELRWHCTNILDILKNSKIKPEVFKELMSQNIFPDKLELHQLINIVKDDAINNIQPQNIKFLKDLKNNPVTSFLFTEPVYNLSNYNIPKILTMKLPADFELANQKQALKLISYINNDKGKREVIGSFNAMANVQLLVKNDDFEQGKKLVDFIVENELCSCNSSEFLLRNSFEKNLNILKQIQNIEILNDKRKDGSLDPDNYYDAIAYPIEIVEKQLELIEYANQKSAFEGMYLNTWGCKGEVERQEAGVDPSNPEEIKKNIDKLAKISELMTPKLWGKIRSDALAKTLNNDKMANVNFKKENIEYFNKLISDERIEKIFNIYSSELINWLQQDLDCDALFANYEDKLKFAEKYKDEIHINDLITFTGDIKKLENIYEQLKKESTTEKVWVEIETATNNINFSTDNKEYIYDKNLNLLTSSVINQKQKKDGEIQTVTTFEDKQKNITNTITYKKDAIYEYPVPTHIVTKYSDKANNLIKTKIYDESSLDGVYNIKELYPNGKIKTISTGYQNSDGEFFEKNLESLDGTQSHILYNKDNSGNENYEYHIIDKEGNELLNLKRTTEFIDENTKVTTVNDKKYKVIYSENTIKILDINNNKETNINLEELNPDNDSVLKDMLKSLSGDELINLQKYVKKLELTARIQSSINPVSKTMYIGPHKFIFEHELGHAKDEINATVNEIANLENIDDLERKITKDPQLQAIFEMEKNLLKEKLPKEILKEANYFINDTNHYGGKLGGLAETIAEINAIQTTPKFHPLLIMRTEILQEYFPKTIAYLINNSL